MGLIQNNPFSMKNNIQKPLFMNTPINFPGFIEINPLNHLQKPFTRVEPEKPIQNTNLMSNLINNFKQIPQTLPLPMNFPHFERKSFENNPFTKEFVPLPEETPPKVPLPYETPPKLPSNHNSPIKRDLDEMLMELVENKKVKGDSEKQKKRKAFFENLKKGKNARESDLLDDI